MSVPKAFRVWTFLIYPESAPSDWRSLLDNLHFQYVVSPLHEYDINPDGELKKPHFHVVCIFEGKKSYDQVLEITHLLNTTIPQNCLSLRGIVRYLVHLDNPEKHQYDIKDIECHGGADIDDLLKATVSEEKSTIHDIISFIRSSDIIEFEDLIYYCEDNKSEWSDLLMDKYSFFISKILDSKRNRVLWEARKKKYSS